jgi:hypothetical protein
MNKITKACKYCFVYNYYTSRNINCFTFKIFRRFLNLGHFCFVVVYAKTIIHLSVDE